MRSLLREVPEIPSRSPNNTSALSYYNQCDNLRNILRTLPTSRRSSSDFLLSLAPIISLFRIAEVESMDVYVGQHFIWWADHIDIDLSEQIRLQKF